MNDERFSLSLFSLALFCRNVYGQSFKVVLIETMPVPLVTEHGELARVANEALK